MVGFMGFSYAFYHCLICIFFYVRLTGLEPARRETPDPKSGASTNSATGALIATVVIDSGRKGMIFFSFHQKFSGKFYQSIFAAAEVFVCQPDGIVGRDAEFGVLTVAVVHRAGGEANHPSVG